MENDKWMTVLKGLIVGATMIVPGVSGGTMAMILGIYDQLISAVSSFHKNIKENFTFYLFIYLKTKHINFDLCIFYNFININKLN